MISTPTHSADSDDEKLVPFVDMIFGGQLTSILVCEKCKHISQTQEEFNDISLSIKPEDYTKERKRDRFKTFAKRFASFQTQALGGGGEMLRSSSVPPGSRGHVNQLAEQPIDEGSRRRSLDIIANGSIDDIVVVEKVKGEESRPEDAVGTSPITPDSKQQQTGAEDTKPVVGFAEPPKVEKKEKKKEKDDASWSKFSRRISLSIGLGKDKERNSRPRDVSPKALPDFPANKQKENEERSLLQSAVIAMSTPSTSVGHTVDSSPEVVTPGEMKPSSPFIPEKSKLRIRKSDSRHKSLPVLPPTSSATSPAVPPSLPRFPTIQQISTRRSKSPHPPKPTAEETAYLRQILADVTPASSNPFTLFKASTQYGNNGVTPSSSSYSAAHAMWLKMGHLPGIEDCLRMFTAVEILDGENMVGCRRCWKIANGEYNALSQSDGELAEDDLVTVENNKGEEYDLSRSPENAENSPPVQSSSAPSSPFSSLPASMSSPIISMYSHPNRSDSVSVSSLPALDTSTPMPSSNSKVFVTPSLLLKDDSSSAEFLTASSGSSTPSRSIPLTELPSSPLTARPPPILRTTEITDAPSQVLLIPSISTTAPESPSSPLTARPKFPVVLSSSRLTSPKPGDSLATPKVFHKRPKESDFYDSSCESSGTESDASTTSSICDRSENSSPTLASSGLSPQPSEHSKESSAASKKGLRSKQVIMRAAYKRYLIGTPPPVLVVHLKRFQQISRTHMISFSHGFKKLDDYVTFHEYLDLTPFLAPKKEDFGLGKARKKRLVREKDKERCMYRLYAVVVHIGNMARSQVHFVSFPFHFLFKKS